MSVNVEVRQKCTLALARLAEVHHGRHERLARRLGTQARHAQAGEGARAGLHLVT